MMNRLAELQQKLALLNTSYGDEVADDHHIESTVPDCLFIALEQQARHIFNIPNFNRAFGEHSFHFIPKDYANLDIHFGRYEDDDYYRVENGFISGYVANKIRALYGLRVCVTSYSDITQLADYLINAFNQRESVVCEYSARCIPERIEDYQKHYGYHIATIRGYNQDKQKLIIDDVQKCGMAVSINDFLQSFDDLLNHEGEVNIYTLEYLTEGIQMLTTTQVQEDIQRNIDGIYTQEPLVGLNSIDKFMEHIAYLPRAKGPYIVPGVWVFSLQRQASIAWLKALQDDFPNLDIGTICLKMQQNFMVLAKKWKELEYLMTLSVKTTNVTGRTIYQRFEELFALEKRAIPLWLELQAVFNNMLDVPILKKES